jgi:hypothetical protein
MQGATLEAALVLAAPRDLTAGWSYATLFRVRGESWLLVYNREFSEDQSEFGPAHQAPRAAREEFLARVQRQLLERDIAQLASERLGHRVRPELDEQHVPVAVALEEPGERAPACDVPDRSVALEGALRQAQGARRWALASARRTVRVLPGEAGADRALGQCGGRGSWG